MEKHYDGSYLKGTFEKMMVLKKSSYQTFSEINHGTLIDFGCGTGDDIANMASLFPSIDCVGIDHDPRLQALANAQHQAANLTYKLGDITEIKTIAATQSIVGVRMERVLQHNNPIEPMIEAVFNALSEKGIFTIVETDWSNLNFYCLPPYLEQKIVAYYTQKKVVNGYVLKALPNKLIVQGFQNMKFRLHPIAAYTLEEANKLIMLEKVLVEMQELNLLTVEELHHIQQELHRSQLNNYFSVSLNMVLITCNKA